jgi:hypothetical protein
MERFCAFILPLFGWIRVSLAVSWMILNSDTDKAAAAARAAAPAAQEAAATQEDDGSDENSSDESSRDEEEFRVRLGKC